MDKFGWCTNEHVLIFWARREYGFHFWLSKCVASFKIIHFTLYVIAMTPTEISLSGLNGQLEWYCDVRINADLLLNFKASCYIFWNSGLNLHNTWLYQTTNHVVSVDLVHGSFDASGDVFRFCFSVLLIVWNCNFMSLWIFILSIYY